MDQAIAIDDAAPLTPAALTSAIDLLTRAVTQGLAVTSAAELLAASRASERLVPLALALRSALLAEAEDQRAGEIDGLNMADVISEERRIPKSEATSELRRASAHAAFPNALAAAAVGRISQPNLETAVKALEQMQPFYPAEEFPAAEAALLKEAEGTVPAIFRKKCRTSLSQLDESLRRANNAATAKRRKQSFDDRGLVITLIEDGEFGANVWGHIPTEYLRKLKPALDRKAEADGRAQRHSSRQAKDLRVRMLDALFTLVTGSRPPQADDITADGTSSPRSGERPDLFSELDASEPASGGRTDAGAARSPSGVGSTASDTKASAVGADAAHGSTAHVADAAPTIAAGVDTAGSASATDTVIDELLAAPERTRHLWDTDAEDLGRDRRLASRGLRELLTLRDGGCVFPMCTDPPEVCIAHHVTSWEAGGRTDMRNLALICTRHHPRVEHPPGDPNHWTIVLDDAGIPAARPPVRYDPARQLIYHPRLTPPTCGMPLPSQLQGRAAD